MTVPIECPCSKCGSWTSSTNITQELVRGTCRLTAPTPHPPADPRSSFLLLGSTALEKLPISQPFEKHPHAIWQSPISPDWLVRDGHFSRDEAVHWLRSNQSAALRIWIFQGTQTTSMERFRKARFGIGDRAKVQTEFDSWEFLVAFSFLHSRSFLCVCVFVFIFPPMKLDRGVLHRIWCVWDMLGERWQWGEESDHTLKRFACHSEGVEAYPVRKEGAPRAV